MSTLAIWCRVVQSRVVRSRDFSVPTRATGKARKPTAESLSSVSRKEQTMGDWGHILYALLEIPYIFMIELFGCQHGTDIHVRKKIAPLLTILNPSCFRRVFYRFSRIITREVRTKLLSTPRRFRQQFPRHLASRDDVKWNRAVTRNSRQTRRSVIAEGNATVTGTGWLKLQDWTMTDRTIRTGRWPTGHSRTKNTHLFTAGLLSRKHGQKSKVKLIANRSPGAHIILRAEMEFTPCQRHRRQQQQQQPQTTAAMRCVLSNCDKDLY